MKDGGGLTRPIDFIVVGPIEDDDKRITGTHSLVQWNLR